MRLRNDNGDWSDWQPFANSFTWTIADGRGQHYVAAELRSEGTTRSSCDMIRSDVPAVAADGKCPQEALLTGHPERSTNCLRIKRSGYERKSR